MSSSTERITQLFAKITVEPDTCNAEIDELARLLQSATAEQRSDLYWSARRTMSNAEEHLKYQRPAERGDPPIRNGWRAVYNRADLVSRMTGFTVPAAPAAPSYIITRRQARIDERHWRRVSRRRRWDITQRPAHQSKWQWRRERLTEINNTLFITICLSFAVWLVLAIVFAIISALHS